MTNMCPLYKANQFFYSALVTRYLVLPKASLLFLAPPLLQFCHFLATNWVLVRVADRVGYGAAVNSPRVPAG